MTNVSVFEQECEMHKNIIKWLSYKRVKLEKQRFSMRMDLINHITCLIFKIASLEKYLRRSSSTPTFFFFFFLPRASFSLLIYLFSSYKHAVQRDVKRRASSYFFNCNILPVFHVWICTINLANKQKKLSFSAHTCPVTSQGNIEGF